MRQGNGACMMNFPAYSVLLSVCNADKPEWLSIALDSMLNQTIKPDEIVIVLNGPLDESLCAAINRYKEEKPGVFKILPLPCNMSLGSVIRQGMIACSNGFVAYTDADGYSAQSRIEEEFEALFVNKADFVGANVNEFSESVDNIACCRVFPESPEEIYRFAKRKMPMAFSSALLKKRMVLACFDYEDCIMAEDYALFIDLLSFCAKGYNVQKPLVYKRLSEDCYKDRGSWEYVRAMRRFNEKFFKRGWFRYRDYFFRSMVNEIVFMMPRFVKTFVYNKVL